MQKNILYLKLFWAILLKSLYCTLMTTQKNNKTYENSSVIINKYCIKRVIQSTYNPYWNPSMLCKDIVQKNEYNIIQNYSIYKTIKLSLKKTIQYTYNPYFKPENFIQEISKYNIEYPIAQSYQEKPPEYKEKPPEYKENHMFTNNNI